MLKAVTFDLWNTVIKEQAENSIEEVVIARVEDILSRHGMERSRQDIIDATIRCRDKVMALQVHEGKEMPPEEQLTWIVNELGIPLRDKLMAELYTAYTTASLEQLPKPVLGIEQVLTQLKGQMDLALICNTGRTPGSTARIILEQLGLKPYFSHLIFSNEVGVAKPHPQIFLQALTALRVQPKEAVHIGDDPRTDVKGAKGVGMKAAWLAYGREPTGVECDVIVNKWEDFLTWVKEQRNVKKTLEL